jgi:hypothetical protein
MAMHWPFRTDISDPTNIAPTASKSIAHSNIPDGNKSNVSFGDKNILQQTFSHLQSNKESLLNPNRVIGKKAEMNIPTDSEFSLNGRQQRIEWNLKAQEGVITYRLPDGLPDGFALHTKLHKLMKTNTIYLNDRRFWTTLENRFKNLRKVFFYLTKIYLFFIIQIFSKIFNKIWNVYVKINNNMNKN